MIEDRDQNNITAPPDKKRRTDPRDTEFVIKYDKKNFNRSMADDESTGMSELYQLISVVIGVIAYLTRTKWAFWVALFFYYTSCVNTSSETRL